MDRVWVGHDLNDLQGTVVAFDIGEFDVPRVVSTENVALMRLKVVEQHRAVVVEVGGAAMIGGVFHAFAVDRQDGARVHEAGVAIGIKGDAEVAGMRHELGDGDLDRFAWFIGIDVGATGAVEAAAGTFFHLKSVAGLVRAGEIEADMG